MFGVNTAPPGLRSLSTGAFNGKHGIVHTKQFLDGWVFVEALNSFAITHPPQPLSPAHLFICAIHDYYSGCEKVAQNPTVLIASRNSYKTLPKGLFQLYSISNLATSHTRKS